MSCNRRSKKRTYEDFEATNQNPSALSSTSKVTKRFHGMNMNDDDEASQPIQLPLRNPLLVEEEKESASQHVDFSIAGRFNSSRIEVPDSAQEEVDPRIQVEFVEAGMNAVEETTEEVDAEVAANTIFNEEEL